MLLLTSYLQEPSCPLDHRTSASTCAQTATPSFLCAEGRSNPYAVSTDYCKVMYVQTLPEEFFMCANLLPSGKHGTGGPAAWGAAVLGMHVQWSQPWASILLQSLLLTSRFSSCTPKKWRELPQTWKRDRKHVKCNNTQLLHPGWYFFSRILHKNYACQGLLSAPQKTK